MQTVVGKIRPESLGFCHSHEHIMLKKGKSFEQNPALCAESVEKSLAELKSFYAVGGRALVDAQPVGCGRMSAELADISVESGVHIIASTGFHKMIFYEEFHWIFTWSEKRLQDLFVHEIMTGMFTGSDQSEPVIYHNARAGVIKTALDTIGLDKQYRKLFSAASGAQLRTGAPMLIHIENNADPLMLDDFLASRGVMPEKRIYCHLDRAVSDISIHRELCGRGCYLEYDTIHRPKYHSDEAEIAILRQLLDAGFADRILLGLDSTNQRLKAYGGDIGLSYIKEAFIPLAVLEKISESDIRAFMVENPARAFAF